MSESRQIPDTASSTGTGMFAARDHRSVVGSYTSTLGMLFSLPSAATVYPPNR